MSQQFEPATARSVAGRELQLILDTVEEGIYGIDAEGRTIFVNRAAARMLGYEPQELLGLPQHETVHHSRANRTPYPIEECPIHRSVRETTRERITDDVFWRKDGTYFNVSYTTTPIREDDVTVGAVVTFVDLTDQKRTEQTARKALIELVQEQAARAEAESMRGQLHRMFEQAPALVALMYGPDHVFELANPLYMELVGNREIVGKPIREAMPEVVSQGFADLLDGVYRDARAFIGKEMRVMLQRQGEMVEGFFNFVYQPLTGPNGNVYGILVHAVEVTEQVRTRQEVERKAAEMAMLMRELERTNRELDQFAYIASHDLKAPLRGVANIAAWLDEDLADVITPEAKQYTHLMRDRVQRMESLINALLEYSRAGRVRGDAKEVDLNALVPEIIETIEPPEHLQIEIETRLPVLVADPIGMQQVFQNLIGNATKYAQSKVRVGMAPDTSSYKFYVSDDGPGIEPRYHDKIWGMFQRLHAPGEGEGTGVGLAIVKKIVDANHGHAWVESKLGAGATFWVEWPRPIHEEPGNDDAQEAERSVA